MRVSSTPWVRRLLNDRIVSEARNYQRSHLSSLSPKHFVDFVCGISLEASENMAVHIESESNSAVTEAFLDDLRVDPSGQ